MSNTCAHFLYCEISSSVTDLKEEEDKLCLTKMKRSKESTTNNQRKNKETCFNC